MTSRPESTDSASAEKGEKRPAPQGWTRLSGVVRQEVGQLLPGRQMTEQELREEMDAFYGKTSDAKSAYKLQMEKLDER